MDSARLKRVTAVAANTFRETVRERVLYNLVFFVILMTLSGLLLGDLSIREDDKIIKDLGLAAMDVFGTLIAIFLGVGLVSKEIERRSLYPLLAKPLDRTEFFLGKFGGLGFTLLVNTVLMTLGVYLALLIAGRSLPLSLLKAVYGIYLGLLLVVAIALLLSSVTSAALAAVGTFGIMIAGRFSAVIRDAREVMPGAPPWVVTFLYYVLPDFAKLDFKGRVAYGDPVPLSWVGWATTYALLYTTVVLALGVASFRRRELV
ncbi:MAG TPA: ABC transporter permease subunit [Vicinamibacteria bacterium]|nr:ABC transporter permease subunit [Vicinamibacteria bacterium]